MPSSLENELSPADLTQSILYGLRVMNPHGGVNELRAKGRDGSIASGFLDDLEAMAREAARLDEAGLYSGIFRNNQILNVDRVGDHVANTATTCEAGDHLASDTDVAEIQWLTIDPDPVRFGPDGQPLADQKVPATDTEMAVAFEVADLAEKWLKELGFPADSLVKAAPGNGAHLNYFVGRLPRDQKALISKCLKAVRAHFAHETRVRFDLCFEKLPQPSRIYGTWNRKGQESEGRPWRRSRIVSAPATLVPVSFAVLEVLAGFATKRKKTSMPVDLPVPDVRGFVERCLTDLDPRDKAHEDDEGNEISTWEFRCPWVPDHAADGRKAFIQEYADGRIVAGCLGDRCNERKLKDLLECLADQKKVPANWYDIPEFLVLLTPPSRVELGVMADAVDPEKVVWLWEGYIPIGSVTMWSGDPGVGKSFAGHDIAARVSKGTAFPDGAPCKQGNVILLDGENHVATSIVPRLIAAGADRSRIKIIKTEYSDKGQRHRIDLKNTLSKLEYEIKKLRARLLVIDVLNCFLPEGTDSHRDQEIRFILSPLAELAERNNCAIIALGHLTKGNGTKAMYRVNGSIGLVGAPRAAFLLAVHPDDAESKDPRRCLANIKPAAKRPPTLAYRLRTTEGDLMPHVEWIKGSLALSSDQIIEGAVNAPQKSAAVSLIDDLFDKARGAPVPIKDFKEAAAQAGISWSSVKRARENMNIELGPDRKHWRRMEVPF